MSDAVMNDVIEVDYEQPACATKHAWVRVPVEPGPKRRAELKDQIRRLLKARNAVMVSHYYVHPDLQDLAEETGGIVSDSLEMARFGRDHAAQTLVVAGVRFMGESAKILSPDKRVLMPDLDATCSLDLGCPADDFAAFCDAHPDRQVVVYANTSAAVKARADWMVTSSCALDVVRHLHEHDPELLIVVLTGFASIATAVEAIKLGASNYLVKPSNTDDIEAAFDGETTAEAIETPLSTRPTSIKTLEMERIHEMLAETNFNISETARRLGMHRRTLARKLAKRWVPQ